MSLFCWTQRKIFWRMWETEQFWGTIDFQSIFFSYYASQWCPKTAWLQAFFKISSFVFGRTKIQVWNYLRVSKWWQNFHFWVNYPFKPFFWSYCRQYMHFTPNKTNVCLPNFSKFLWNDFLFSSGVTLASYSSHLETIYHRTVNSQWMNSSLCLHFISLNIQFQSEISHK